MSCAAQKEGQDRQNDPALFGWSCASQRGSYFSILFAFSVFSFSSRSALTSSVQHSTWLDCSRLMSDFSGRSREFIKACFFHKTHRFLPLYVLGNRSKTLLLPIKICKRTDVPTASRLRSDGTSPKSHRLNFRILIRQAFLQIRILPFLLQ